VGRVFPAWGGPVAHMTAVRFRILLRPPRGRRRDFRPLHLFLGKGFVGEGTAWALGGELTISPLILPWWYQIPTQCKRPKVLLVHALPRGHLSSSPDALLPILSSRPPQLCQLRHARLLPPPTGDSIQTLRLRWPCPQTLRAAERVDVQRSARALNRSPHYAEPCRLRPLVRLAFDPLTVMWFPPAGRWR
jgi:hypothetical protein